MATVAGMHRRKSSREEDEGIVLASNGALQSPQKPVLNGFASAKPSTHDDVPVAPASTAADLSPQRSRVNSAPIASSSPSPPPHSAYVPPPTAGPFQKSFVVSPPPRPGPNGHHHHRPAGSPLRASLSLPSHLQVNAHTRTRSVSGSPFAPALPSPLSMSFPTSSSDHDSSDRPVPMSASAAEFPRAGGHTRTVSYSHPHAHSHSPLHTSGHHHSHHPHAQVGVHTQPQPQLHSHNHIPPPIHTHTPNGTAQHDAPPSPTVANAHARRHSRLHSRNLSIYFPRPGSLPHASIAEDGTQEVEFPTSASEPAPVMTIPSPGPRKLGEGFTFGARPPPDAFPSSPSLPSAPGASRSRRGHHHKHSLSHNFFSFLEPGEGADLHTQPTPVPVSPWNPISPFPESARPEVTSFDAQQHAHDHGSHSHEHHDHDHGHDHDHDHDSHGHDHDHDHDHDHRPSSPSKTRGRTMVFTTRPSDVGAAPIPPSAIVAATGTFALGAWLWIAGQQVGSLACTGLGYWVVFDAFGVGIARILPSYMRRPSMQSPIRRPYGNSRLEAVVLFAQAVYLLFSAVYVFKECVEHLLLSAGGEGDHHHHPGDEEVNLYGIDFPLLILMTTFLTLIANCLVFRNHSKLMNISGTKLPSLASIFDPARYKYASRTADSTSLPERIWENPFSSIPIIISLAIFLIPTIIPPSQHRGLDLLLASAEAIAMFYLAYPSCVTIGAVLLQTSPPRGHASGRMEAFLRAMREIERHPQVQHLPPPHIWQLTPTEDDPAKSLIVTLELRVAHELADEDVLKLTKWAWERCVNALGLNREDAKEGGGGVTVGVVRG